MSTIPASQIVAGNPDVLAAGGETLDMVGLFLTTNDQVPIGDVQSFGSPEAVSDYFGASSAEAALSSIYFAGFKNATRLPGAMLFSQYNTEDVSAFLRSGDISGMSLATLQAINGSLNILIDGYARNAGAVNLSGASSFSSAAATIETALNAAAGTLQAITARIGGNITASIAGTTMTVTVVANGEINVGDLITGGSVDPDTTVTAFVGGTGGTGTYTVSVSQTEGSGALVVESNVLVVSAQASATLAPGQSVDSSGTTAMILEQLTGADGGLGKYLLNGDPQEILSESMNTVPTPVDVAYDSVSGGFVIASGALGEASTMAYATGTISATLLMTAATGAVLSQGAVTAVPGTFMAALIAEYSNFASFTTTFDPDASGFDNKLAFATWNGQQNDRFAYIAVDADTGPALTAPDAGCLSAAIDDAEISGTAPLWATNYDTGVDEAAFIMGAAASINFDAVNGRITFAGKSQSGLVGDVTDGQIALNLGGNPQSSGRGNGYNFYGAYGAANNDFIWFQRGFVSGEFLWLDSYINQIWLNNRLKIAALDLIDNTNSIPFSSSGDGLIASALQDAINAGLNFGAYEPGEITAGQRVQVDTDAGRSISQTLETQGWYLLIRAADGTQRANRGPRQVVFFYLDRGSVQSINLGTVAVL